MTSSPFHMSQQINVFGGWFTVHPIFPQQLSKRHNNGMVISYHCTWLFRQQFAPPVCFRSIRPTLYTVMSTYHSGAAMSKAHVSVARAYTSKSVTHRLLSRSAGQQRLGHPGEVLVRAGSPLLYRSLIVFGTNQHRVQHRRRVEQP